jgi:hypothetical protein
VAPLVERLERELAYWEDRQPTLRSRSVTRIGT